jgi:hypothetical protein
MTIFPKSPEMQATWDDLMAGLFDFVSNTQSDLDASHDWLCDQLQIDSLLNEETMGRPYGMCEVDDDCWSEFYKTWQSAYDGNNWWGSEIPA